MSDQPEGKTPPPDTGKDWQVVVQREEGKEDPATPRAATPPRAPAGARPATPKPVVKIVVTIVLVVGLGALVVGVALGPRARSRGRTAEDARIVTPTPPTPSAPATPQPAAPPVTRPAAPPVARPPAPPAAAPHTGTVYGLGSRGDGKVKWNGKTVYVPGTAVGDEVTFTIADDRGDFAVGRLVSKRTPPGAAAPDSAPVPGKEQIFRATVTEVGSKGDARMRANGKTVYVPGAKKGDDISFVISDDRGRYAIGKLVQTHATGVPDAAPEKAPAPAPLAPPDPAKVLVGAESKADDIREGQLFKVSVTEKERRNPDKNGVARIGGFVVFVPGTQPGDRVVIRITKRSERVAFSEVIERLEAEAAPPAEAPKGE